MDTPGGETAARRERRRILLELGLGAGLVAVVLAGPWAEAGPYGWVALLQLKVSGSFSDKWTLLLSLLLWAVLGGLAWWLWGRLFGEATPPGPSQPVPEVSGGRTWIPAGACLFGTALVALSSLVLALPPAPRTLADPAELAQGMALWPVVVAAPAWADSPWVDLDHQMGLRHGQDTTLFIPVHAPGEARLAGLVALARPTEGMGLDLKAGVATLEPVPLVIRRACAEAGFEAPLFLPILRPGSSRADVVVLWLIAGGVVAAMAGWLWRKAWARPAP